MAALHLHRVHNARGFPEWGTRPALVLAFSLNTKPCDAPSALRRSWFYSHACTVRSLSPLIRRMGLCYNSRAPPPINTNVNLCGGGPCSPYGRPSTRVGLGSMIRTACAEGTRSKPIRGSD